MMSSRIIDTAFVARLVLRTSPLGPNGEQLREVATEQVSVEGIVGSPEGRAAGNIGDVRIQIDVAAIWVKTSGPPRSTIGWTQLPDVGSTGPQGAQGPEGDQGAYGTTDAFDNLMRNVSAGALNGARAPLGIPSGVTGTPSHPTLTPTSRLTSTPRTRYSTTVGAGQAAALRSGLGLWWRGNAAGLGGFDLVWQFGLASFASGFRSFVGLRAIVGLIPNVDPSTLVNIIGIGLNAGATQWSLMHNDAAGAAVVVPLGGAFDVSATDLLQLRLTCAANGATVDYEVTNLESGAVAAGTLAADIPAAAVFLSSHVWANTGTDATTALLLDVGDIDSEMASPSP